MGRKQWKTIKKEREERKRKHDQLRVERKGEYADYLKSERWQLLRSFAYYRVERDYGKLICEECKKSKPKYNVHHWRYPDNHNYENDSPNFHELLCVRCHEIRHDLIPEEEKTDEERKPQTFYMEKAMKEMLDRFGKKRSK